MADVVIFGAGDFARVAHVYLERDSEHRVVAFTAHEQHVTAPKLAGLDVVPFERLSASHPPSQCAMFVAIGFRGVNKARAEVYEQCEARGYELISYVNSRAISWGDVAIGKNCFILENNVLQPFVRIGNDVVLWSGNHIGHDSTIGDHCFIASHAVISGNVHVGAFTFIGVNATLRDGITIGERCVIGAGALILRDTKANEVYMGKATEVARLSSGQLRGF
jgi:sugar O-acyltransferase (sialic acid O-acetyltransferase NeuD family)